MISDTKPPSPNSPYMKQILHRFKAEGCVCQIDPTNRWRIYPPLKGETWKLQQDGDRWILLISQKPQISLTSNEAVAFVKRRLQALLHIGISP
ncbi:MAG: hypothetical protein ACFE0J_16315 [Elainellaceae cyanobacterium]